MEPIEFEKKIEINPIYLDSNIRKTIVKIIQDLKICNAKDGHITEICDIKSIESVGISRHTNFPVVKVVFTAYTIKPQPGSEYLCRILKFNEYGFTLEHPNAPLVVFVQLEMGVVDMERQEFTYKGKVLKVGDMVWVVLKEYHYSCKKFASIGYLKEDNLPPHIPDPPPKTEIADPSPPVDSDESSIPHVGRTIGSDGFNSETKDNVKKVKKTPPKREKRQPKAEVKRSPSVFTSNSVAVGKSVKKYKF